MKKVLLLFLIFLVFGCIGEEKWTVYVVDGGVKEYTLEELKAFEPEVVCENVIEKEVKKVKWEGVAAKTFGSGDIINYISEDGYFVSIPYDVTVILAYRKEGKSIGKEEGGPLKIAVDPFYGCKCNWLKYVKIVEFVDSENSFSVYGEVFNFLTFSPRDLNLYYGLEDVLNNTYDEAPLIFVLDKAICKQNAVNIVFVTGNGRFSYSLSEIRGKNLVLRYDNGFYIDGLGITDLRGIKVE